MKITFDDNLKMFLLWNNKQEILFGSADEALINTRMARIIQGDEQRLLNANRAQKKAKRKADYSCGGRFYKETRKPWGMFSEIREVDNRYVKRKSRF